MSAEMGGMYDVNGVAEHEVVRLVSGDIETVRRRLSEALEQLGYRVLDENLLRARRRANGWGQNGCTTNVLDYPITLQIGLKAISHNTTRATFDYTVKNPMLVEGDRHTLMREAEALIALAVARAATAACAACGAEAVTGARFCRQCGAPNAATEPAELEVLRLTANSRAAYHSLLSGGLLWLAAVAVALLFFMLDPDAEKFAKRVRVITILAGLFAACGLPLLLSGIWRLHQMLNGQDDPGEQPLMPRRALTVPNTASLPTPAQAAALPPHLVSEQEIFPSITEGTTDLLPQEKQRGQTAEV
ncbi:MAG: hypothetical protein HYR56_03420 [Acidobacteria bacterium]|nr:hypothetical protein [Acidobacteriota bacterium]MBI3422292.1 hypothetical protein [Acidobacteriota bacterium]